MCWKKRQGRVQGGTVTVDRVVRKGFMEKVASKEAGRWGPVDTRGRAEAMPKDL